ncbi:MAG: 4Fe-4S binding protein [Rhodobiaceae bacterium]|nr:4Fe-4S binding protein [Rhodobiaceae bacterium]MCC0041039.1 4Fe-4S binding protein [Rhodobiaceae bacterium]MCC0053930.1 4Fe-4S binding protein [Rhodobiaceae bacterium]
MNHAGRKVLVCNCEKTMQIDAASLAKGLGCAPGGIASHLCRTEIDRFEAALGGGERVLVACTQEAPLFREFAEEIGSQTPLSFTNIRETAGWMTPQGRADKANLNAKIAALLATACIEVKPARERTITSDGVCLVYGAGQVALEAAHRLSHRLSASVLLTDPRDIVPPPTGEVPIYTGRINRATGSLGAFEVIADGYAPMMPSSRSGAQFVMARDGASAQCDLILDLSGGTPLFAGADKRDGYFRVDPNSPVAIAEALFEIVEYVGEFEKPIYVDYDPAICAHARSGKTGCSNCIDACPAGAIAPAGDTVEIDTGICGGCGNCSAVCPTGAASYAFPGREGEIARVNTLLSTYLKAGGANPVVLFHDENHGVETIAAMARFGRGLPANVLPLSVYSVGSVGHDLMAATLAAGATRIIILANPRRHDDFVGLAPQKDVMDAILDGLGHGSAGRIEIIEEADPEAVETRLHEAKSATTIAGKPFAAVGSKREVARAAFAALRESALEQPDIIALPAGAPYGRVGIAGEGCTLCLACVSACPAGALFDNPEKPQVRFQEQACVQCGLCAATCPEKVITLEPRFDFTRAALEQRVLNEDEPFACVRCGKPFGSTKTIRRIRAQLEGKHWMFSGEGEASVIEMCEDCRVATLAERGDDPFRTGQRPRVVTTDDYLKAREKGLDDELSLEDFLKDG